MALGSTGGRSIADDKQENNGLSPRRPFSPLKEEEQEYEEEEEEAGSSLEKTEEVQEVKRRNMSAEKKKIRRIKTNSKVETVV